MRSVPSQLRLVTRRLLRSPMFTSVTVLTLAIGIGANVAIFSVINGVLLKPLAFPEADRLVAIWQTAPGIGMKEINASPATYYTYREEGRAFEDIGLWQGQSATVTGLAEPEHLDSLAVSDGVLPLLGIRPALGRWFDKKEDLPGGTKTVVLSYGYWQRRFGGDPSVIGKPLTVDGESREVIGVLPQGFRFMDMNPSVIVPLQIDRSKVFVGNFSYQSLARLKPGVTLAQANGDVARMLPLLGRKFPPAPGMSPKLIEDARLGPSVRPLKQDLVGDVGKVLWVLMATVGLVLFIACANVANLALVRAEGRQQELAIRAALGAGWSQIARELLWESVSLGALGGALGLALAYAGLRLLVYLSPANLPRLNEITIDGSVVVFAVALSLAAGLLFGLFPAIKYAGRQAGTGLREGGRNASDGRERHRTRSVLVVAQVAMALVLLISSGLMIRTFVALRQVQPGFTSPEEILTVRISIPDAHVPENERVIHMEAAILDKIKAIPGVTAAGLSNAITMDGTSNNDPIFVEGRTYAEGQLPPIRRYRFMGPDFLKTMGNPLIAGRDFTWDDIYNKHMYVMVSENLAQELFGSAAAAVGKRVRENPKGPWREIIGVTGNERDDGVDHKATTIVYWPLLVGNFWQFPERLERYPAIAVRSTRAGSAAFRKEIQSAIWSVDKDLPLADVRTVKEIYSRSMARTSFMLVMLAIAGSMALLLGVVGIYGVISYSVAQRTREIGIRMALGATETSVQKMFLRHGLVLAGVGVVGGVLGAIAATRLMSALLFEVSPVDPSTYAAVSLLLLAAAAMATYVPARRATGVEPVDALRAE